MSTLHVFWHFIFFNSFVRRFITALLLLLFPHWWWLVNEFMLFGFGLIKQEWMMICDEFGRKYIGTCLWSWNAVPLCDISLSHKGTAFQLHKHVPIYFLPNSSQIIFHSCLLNPKPNNINSFTSHHQCGKHSNNKAVWYYGIIYRGAVLLQVRLQNVLVKIIQLFWKEGAKEVARSCLANLWPSYPLFSISLVLQKWFHSM